MPVGRIAAVALGNGGALEGVTVALYNGLTVALPADGLATFGSSDATTSMTRADLQRLASHDRAGSQPF